MQAPGSDSTSASTITAVIIPESPVATKALTVQYASSGGDGTSNQFFFRWIVDGAVVQEGPSGTLEPGPYKKGSSVSVEIIPSNARASGTPFRTKEVIIRNQPPLVSSVDLAPLPAFVGSVVTAAPNGTDPDGDTITYIYQWKVNGKAVTEAENGNQLNTEKLHKKDVISVIATPSDGEVSGAPLESGGITLSNSAPQIISSPPTDLSNGQYTYQVIAKDPDGDKIAFRLDKAPQGMTISPSTGLIRWEPPRQVAGVEEVSVKIAADDGDGGIAYQEYSFTLQMK